MESRDEPSKVKAAIRALTKRQQLPILFIKSKCIGGLSGEYYSDLRDLETSGRLFQLFKEARVSFVRSSVSRT